MKPETTKHWKRFVGHCKLICSITPALLNFQARSDYVQPRMSTNQNGGQMSKCVPPLPFSLLLCPSPFFPPLPLPPPLQPGPMPTTRGPTSALVQQR